MFALIALVMAIVGVTLALQVYLRDSARDHKRALRMWESVYSDANKIIDGEYPDAVQEMAVRLSMTAGCGCYVRSVLIAHYFPTHYDRGLNSGHKGKSEPGDRMKAALHALPLAQKRHVDHLFGGVIAYDMLANPLQGWLLRHAMAKRVAEKEPAPPAAPSREERDAVIRTVAKRKQELELCHA